jgi:hypothetical protein
MSLVAFLSQLVKYMVPDPRACPERGTAWTCSGDGDCCGGCGCVRVVAHTHSGCSCCCGRVVATLADTSTGYGCRQPQRAHVVHAAPLTVNSDGAHAHSSKTSVQEEGAKPNNTILPPLLQSPSRDSAACERVAHARACARHHGRALEPSNLRACGTCTVTAAAWGWTWGWTGKKERERGPQRHARSIATRARTHARTHTHTCTHARTHARNTHLSSVRLQVRLQRLPHLLLVHAVGRLRSRLGLAAVAKPHTLACTGVCGGGESESLLVPLRMR